jgi:penicillin-binding protein 1A
MTGAAWFVYDITVDLQGRYDLRSIGQMAQATTVYDVANQPVFTFYKEQRLDVPLSRVSPHLVHAIVTTEDRRFFEHRGVDSRRILAAAWNNLLEGRAAQGGSTITQQLARQSFLTPDKTLRRKVKEAILAARLEGLYSKEEILELYLNKVYFGGGLFGAEAAARGFFGKPASRLDVSEAALLAGLVKSPSSYAPTVSLDRAVARRNVVLRAMFDDRVIDRETWTQATREPVTLRSTLPGDDGGGLYFKEQVRLELMRLFGSERVYEGGLHVYTTIDPVMQRAADAAVAKSLRDIEARQSAAARARAARGGPLQAALVAIDPRSGEVRALVGGRDFNTSPFNRAIQANRQPGSAFKPFVYAAALESGYSAATIITGLDEPIMTAQGAWTPEDEHSSASAMTLRTALRTSSNRAAVRMIQEVGIAQTVSYAQRLGIGSLPSVPSLALGSGEVTLLSMTRAFGAFADSGFVHRPIIIRRVTDAQGATLFQAAPSRQFAVSGTTAFLMANMLADVINAGTANKARQLGFRLPAAGKTGTTNGFNDAWFIGFTPNLVSGVWVGFDRPHTIVRNGYAADLAVPLWTRFMLAVTKSDEPTWFTPPPDVVAVNICRLSGKLPSAGCDDVAIVTNNRDFDRRSMVYPEFFARGTEPHDHCDLHPRRSFFRTLAGALGVGHPPPHIAANATRLPSAPVAEAVVGEAKDIAKAKAAPAETPPGPAPGKKRGFWGRLFGIGKGRD